MHREEGPPPIDPKQRIPLRMIAVIVCYALYFYLSRERTAPAAFVGLGALLVSWSLIDRGTLRRRERSGLMQVGQMLLGAGMLALGLFLFVTGTDGRPVT